MLIIRGNLVHSKGPEVLESQPAQAVVVNSQGIITYVGPAASCPQPDDTATIIDLKPTQFLLPGFVDGHSHASQYPITGIFSDTLLGWLDKHAFPLESKYSNQNIAQEIYEKIVSRTLQNGTTTISFFGTVHAPATVDLARVCQSQGLRAFVGRVCMERFCPDSLNDGSIESDLALIDGVQKLDPKRELVTPVLTPRFAPSCTQKTLKGLGNLAHERQLPVQTHVSESAGEIELVRELFPEAKNYTDVYDQAGLLKSDTILAHGIHLNQEELDLIKARQSGIVHCPHSNAAIASGIAPVKEYLNQGLKVGLGTDVGGGASVSLLSNLRLALYFSNLLAEQRNQDAAVHGLNLANAIYLATLGGASVFGLDDRIGNFSEGKMFDAQVIDVATPDSPIDLFESLLSEDPSDRLDHILRKWIYIGDDRNTVQVWVAGRKVHERTFL